MKIAVNTRLLLKDKLEGIGWFTFETLKRITKQHPEHQFYFLFDRKFDEEFIFSGNITPLIIPPPARHPFLYITWFGLSIPLVLRSVKPDLFFSPDGFLPLSGNTKSLAVIHDLNFEHYPEDLPLLTRLYYQKYFPKFAAKASRIATVSEFSKADIIKTYGASPEKIDVVYNGANDFYKPILVRRQQQTRAIYAKGKPYFLFIGALHPRKNLANLFAAFDCFKKETGLDTMLMIVGQKKWWTADIENAYKAVSSKEDIIFTGRLSTIELKNVLASALALTYVSIFEGFGIPILEGMYCDTPVIASNITSMPEVGGDAVYSVDPFSVESIKNGMLAIAKDPALREKLIARGRERRNLFTWQKTAEKLWTSVEKVIY